jgi:hypothetical protein
MLSSRAAHAQQTHGGSVPPPFPPRAGLLSWFLPTKRTLRGQRGAFSPLLPRKPTHAKNHAKASMDCVLRYLGADCPQTPTPHIGRAMLTQAHAPPPHRPTDARAVLTNQTELKE